MNANRILASMAFVTTRTAVTLVHVKKATLEKTANASTSPATRRRVKMAGSVDSEINTHTHAIVSPVIVVRTVKKTSTIVPVTCAKMAHRV